MARFGLHPDVGAALGAGMALAKLLLVVVNGLRLLKAGVRRR